MSSTLLAPPARVVYSSLFFALSMLLVIVAKPAALFTESGRVRPFGPRLAAGSGRGEDGQQLQQQRTVFSLGVVVVVGAVLSMLIFSCIDLVYS